MKFKYDITIFQSRADMFNIKENTSEFPAVILVKSTNFLQLSLAARQQACTLQSVADLVVVIQFDFHIITNIQSQGRNEC